MVETRGKQETYSELGKMLDALARIRGVRGPYNIANYVKDVTGYEASGQAVSKYLYGETRPRHTFVKAFADAFKLTDQERAELSWVYAYGSRPSSE